jgi:hypothetical protein
MPIRLENWSRRLAGRRRDLHRSREFATGGYSFEAWSAWPSADILLDAKRVILGGNSSVFVGVCVSLALRSSAWCGIWRSATFTAV